MSTTNPAASNPNLVTRNDLIADAKSLPDLIRKAQAVDPDLASMFTGKALLASKSVWGNAIALVVSWVVTRYGLGWDANTSAMVTGAIVMVATLIFRALTGQPITGIFTAAPASTAAMQGSTPLTKVIALLFAIGFALTLAACGKQTPSQAAQDISLAASGLQAALGNMPGVSVPPAVTSALADLQAEAGAFAAADSQAAQQTVVKRVEADINAIVAAAGSIPGLPPKALQAVQLADVLLPVIEMEVNMIPAASAAASGTSADVARAGLKNP